jgi:uncharacterized protein with PIN domain
MSVIHFNEIPCVKNASVRVTEDEMLYAIDLTCAVTGLARKQASTALLRLDEDMFSSSKFIDRHGPRGGQPIKLISVSDAIELVMVLPGKMAKTIRTQFADIIKRYMTGDETLEEEIKNNARKNMESEGKRPVKRQKLLSDIDIDNRKADVERKQAENTKLIAEVDRMQVENNAKMNEHQIENAKQKMALAMQMAETCRNIGTIPDLDVQIRETLKEFVLKAGGCKEATPNEGDTKEDNDQQEDDVNAQEKEEEAEPKKDMDTPPPNAPVFTQTTQSKDTSAEQIMLSTIAKGMGRNLTNDQLIKLGAKVASAYWRTYGKAPAKEERKVNGAVRSINVYTAKDQNMIIDCVRALWG